MTHRTPEFSVPGSREDVQDTLVLHGDDRPLARKADWHPRREDQAGKVLDDARQRLRRRDVTEQDLRRGAKARRPLEPECARALYP